MMAVVSESRLALTPGEGFLCLCSRAEVRLEQTAVEIMSL
jgi:hypothetical protein